MDSITVENNLLNEEKSPLKNVEPTKDIHHDSVDEPISNGIATNVEVNSATNGLSNGDSNGIHEPLREVLAEVHSGKAEQPTTADKIEEQTSPLASTVQPTETSPIYAEEPYHPVAREPITTLPTIFSPPQEVEATPDVASVPELIYTAPIIVPEPQPIEPAPITVPELPVEASPIVAVEPELVTKDANDNGLFIIADYIHEAINNVAVSLGFSNFSYTHENGAVLGDGFIGEILRVKISGLLGGNQSTLKIIVKQPPTSQIRRDMAMKLFERETYMYNVILPVFNKFQLDHNVKPDVSGFFAYPKCHYAYFNKEQDQSFIIMEDIRESGFSMENKLKPVQFTHAKAVMENLGQLHGISLAMKKQRPEEFAKYQSLKDVMNADDSPIQKQMLEQMMDVNVNKAILTLDDNETALKEKVLKAGKKILDADFFAAKHSEPYSVINHGDSWINNMMFRYEVS